MLIEIDHHPINCHIVGDGKPVFLLHGLGCDHRLMMGCMEPVFARYPASRRIYIDLPGMGASDASLELCSSDRILELLNRLAERLTDGEPFLLAGESYGGYLAQGMLASCQPGLVDGLLLICPVVIAGHAERDVPAHRTLLADSDFLARLSLEGRTRFGEYAVVADQYTYTRYENELLPGILAADGPFLKRLADRYAFTFDLRQKIRALHYDRPVLLIAGRQDDCVGYRDLWRTVEEYPRATYAVLDLAGHNLQIEQPALFNSLIENWLERIERS